MDRPHNANSPASPRRPAGYEACFGLFSIPLSPTGNGHKISGNAVTEA